MKYIKKMPSTDKELSEKLLLDGWKKLKEPSNLEMSILLSIPLMIINGIISIVISFYLYPPLKDILSIEAFSFKINIDIKFMLYIIIFIIFIMIHEFIHAAFIPTGLKSEKVFWGISGVAAFIYTTKKIKMRRYLIITIMPFIILSILLPFLLKGIGLLNYFTIFLCFINALGSSVDLLNFILISIQVPKNSYIISNGTETFFK